MAAEQRAAAGGADPAGDAAGLESEMRTQDGETIRIRPIRPDDGPRLVDFHEHLSDQSVFRRYFRLHPHLSAGEVEHLTHVDLRDRLALVAEHDGALVGVGRYERLPGTDEAEVAFVVADRYQHRGIGSELLARVAAAARARGIRALSAETQADNRAMIDVFLHAGFPYTSEIHWGTVSVRFTIDDAAPSGPGGLEAEGGRDAGPATAS